MACPWGKIRLHQEKHIQDDFASKKMQICKFYRFATQGRFLARQMQFYEDAKNEKAPHEGALCCHDG
ncbi:MAG: hypothetical protein MSA67_10755 [Desulfovibrio piger]|nr:hypothetical protein [Desulfovibrio piger]